LKMEGVPGEPADAPGAEPRPATIGELLAHSAARFGDKPALQIRRHAAWHRVSYAELQRGAEAVRDRLRAIGLRKGDRGVLWWENQPEWGLASLGAALAGIVVVPLDWQTWQPEVWAIARYTGARALMVSDVCAKRLTADRLAEAEAADTPLMLLNVNRGCAPPAGGAAPAAVEASAASTEEVVGADDPASIIFTSGTASDPKGAVHTHRSFLANVFGVLRFTPQLGRDDEMLSVLPLYHALEFTCGFL